MQTEQQHSQPQPVAKINWLAHKHIPRIVFIAAECGHTEYTRGSLAKLLRHEDINGFGYFYKSSLIAYMIFRQDRDEYEILDIAVCPSYQRKKFGTRLIEQLKKKVGASVKFNHIRTHVDEQRTDVHFFLKSCGLRGLKVKKAGGKWPRDRYVFGYDYVEPQVNVPSQPSV